MDVLKLDMGFLDARESSRGGLILASIVRMARWLNLPVIAEGVETQKQAAYLASIGCEYMQGYLFSRPVDRETFERMLMDGGRESVKRPIIENLQDDASEFWSADSPVTHFFNSYVGRRRHRRIRQPHVGDRACEPISSPSCSACSTIWTRRRGYARTC